MDRLSHSQQVLVMTLSELAFLIPAAPLYIFLVMPGRAEGTLPGIVPIIGGPLGIGPSIMLAISIFFVSLGMAALLYRFFGNTHFASNEMMQLVDEFSERDFIPIYLAAGIGEEALFRAALLEPCGLVVSSLLFTALHIAYWRKPLMLAYVFAAGLLFGVLYLFTESLLLCIVVHAAFNTCTSILLKRRIITPRG